MASARIWLADDHAIVREGVRRLLERESGFAVAGESGSLNELEAASLDNVEVLMLDINWPDATSFETIKLLTAKFDKLKILVFSMQREPDVALRALRAGARGFIDKNQPPEAIVEALKKLLRDGRYIPEALSDYMLEQQIDLKRAPHESLSDREYAVFQALGAGKKPTAIAVEFKLSDNTISSYVYRIKQKLGVSSLGEIVAYFHRIQS